MKNSHVSRILFGVILLIFLFNAIVSTANLIEDGAVLKRVVPAISWSVGTIIWIALYFRKARGENKQGLPEEIE